MPESPAVMTTSARSGAWTGSTQLKQALKLTGLVGALAAAAAIASSQALWLPMSHDEHQFVVGGWLLGKYGLLPYRDFPSHHLPNLLLLYALIGRLTPAALLNARLISVALGLATLVLIARLAWNQATAWSGSARWLVSLGAPAALLLSPLYAYTSGRAWNHDLPVASTMAALVLTQTNLFERSGPTKWLAVGGLLGLAVGSRVAFVPAVIPFAVASVGAGRQTRPGGRWWAPSALLLAGLSLGLLPTVVLAAAGPRGFFYGSAVYPLLNARYRELLIHGEAMSLPGKFLYLAGTVILDPAHLLLLAGFGLVLIQQLRVFGVKTPRVKSGFWLASWIALALLVGALLPTPSWYQYFYAPLPFLVAGIVLGAGELVNRAGGERLVLAAAGLAVLLIAGIRRENLQAVNRIGQLDSSVPIQIHALGSTVAARLNGDDLLTLAPIVALEGGLEPVPALTNGAFDWRVATLLSAGQRARYGVSGPADLEQLLADDLPAGILVGFETGNEGFSLDDPKALERPLETFAVKHGYRPYELPQDAYVRHLTLWIRAATPANLP